MNIKKAIITAFFIVVLMISGVRAYAMTTGFATDEMPLEEQKVFLSNCSIDLIDSDDRTDSFTCFDVDERGFIALGIDNSTSKKIYIYNSEGEFQYGYSFENSGTFSMEWDNENIIIYFTRSGVAALVDKKARIIELRMISESLENYDYRTYVVFATKRTVGNIEYEMKNDPGIIYGLSPSYSQLIKLDQQGNMDIIYDCSSFHNARVILIFGVFLLLFTMVPLGLFMKYGRKK